MKGGLSRGARVRADYPRKNSENYHKGRLSRSREDRRARCVHTRARVCV